MIYLLLESDYNVLNPVESDFIKKFHSSSVKRIEGSIDKDLVKLLAQPPLLDAGWLLLCNAKGFRWELEKLRPMQNTVLIKVAGKYLLSGAVERVAGYEYRVIDNYRLDPAYVKFWIRKKLLCDDGVATYLYNRVQGRLKNVVEAVQLLEGTPVVGRKLIADHIPEVSKVSEWSVVRYMLGVEERCTYEEIVQWLYEFRYAGKWLKSKLLEGLRLFMDVYTAMGTGELNLMNYKEFLAGTDVTSMKQTSAYRVKEVIELHDCVSSEYVYYLILRVAEYSGMPSGLYHILNILRLGGNDVYRL